MTSIIFRGIENRNFSIIKFIIARARRIIPALVVIILIVLLIGYLFFEPMTYQMIGRHASSSLAFASNIMYQSEAGYFDDASKSKFLLHTWSLSVEWQFYIIYPIILVILSKLITFNSLKKTILVLSIASFIWCVYVSKYSPVDSYFSLPSRAWEMMVGGVAFLYPIKTSDNKRRVIGIIGIAMIAISLFIMNEEMSWPSYLATVPVLGAYACILANDKKSPMSNFVFNRIGLWSYSIYLIHWPVIVFFNKMDINLGVLMYASIVTIGSIFLYETIEKRREYKWGLLFSYILCMSISVYASIDGVSSRIKNPDYHLNKDLFRRAYEGHLWMQPSDNVDYFNATEDDFDYIIIGDSHARHYFAYFKQSGLKVASLASDGCKATKHFVGPINYSAMLDKICKGRYEKTVDFINSHPGKKIIWMQAWYSGRVGDPINPNDNYENDFVSEIKYFLDDIKGSKSSVYIIGDTQGSKQIMYQCLASQDLPINKIFRRCESEQDYIEHAINNRFELLAEKNNNVHFIDPSPAICKDSKCIIVDGDMPVYTDNTHLTRDWSVKIGSYIFSKIK